MVKVKPFKAVRPGKSLADKVAALPYDVMNSEEAREMVKDNPYSFLHVDKAEVDLDPAIGLYDEKVYLRARENLYQMMENSVLIQDGKDCYYIYKQVMQGRPQTGLVCCSSIDDYLNNKIKKNEHTRADKEQDRINHVDYCDANTGPIFLTYKENSRISQIIEQWMASAVPESDFVSEDGVQQIVWLLDNAELIAEITRLFAGMDSLYIADGHHRTASAAKVGIKRREQNPGYSGDEEFNFFLTVLFPDNQLKIMDYNRVVRDLNGLDKDQFLTKVGEKFSITPCDGNKPCHPPRPQTYGMYLDSDWYLLEAKSGIFDLSDPLDSLDVSILQNNLLRPILDIDDPRTNKRIDFIGGIRGLAELERRCQEDMQVAFSLYPTSISQLISLSDAGQIMPPKTTWFEPKLRSGLFIHLLK